MRKILLIAGIVIAAAAVLCLLYAALNQYGYKNIYDGSAELYRRLRHRATAYFIGGGVLAVISAACFIIRTRL